MADTLPNVSEVASPLPQPVSEAITVLGAAELIVPHHLYRSDFSPAE